MIKFTEQFTSATVSSTLHGESHSFTFEYRDPWEWILSLVQDESLAPLHMWNSVRKYYCCGDHEERIYDEPNTADTWWEIDVSFPSVTHQFRCLVTNICLVSRNFRVLRQTVCHTATSLSISGWIKALLLDAYPSIRWSYVQHGFHAKLETHLEMEVESLWDTCLW